MDAVYRADLAHIHDAGFTAFARNAGSGLLQLFAHHQITEGRIVDLGCGSGVWARMLVDAGYEVHGIDISKDMIDLCRARVPEATFVVDSFLKAQLPACKVVTSIGECLNYLFDTSNNLTSLEELFERVYQALEDGGLFVFDIIEPGYAAATGPPKRHVLTDTWAVLVEIEEDAANNTLKRSITSFKETGGAYRREEEVHHVQLYRGEDLKRVLENVGFSVTLNDGYPDFSLTATHAVLIAQKT